jgi:diphosphomevalonate decarboxylase
VVYYLADHETEVAGLFKAMLKGKEGWESRRGNAVKENHVALDGMEVAVELLQKGVSRVILTSVGDGPRKTEEHLC